MTDNDESGPYRVEAADGQFQVRDEEGNLVITCSDSANAGQYAALMNQAYRRGYRSGYRQARKA